MQQRSSATRTRILNAAQRLFLVATFADVTIDCVAAAAETTKGGVYHHFASKEELYLAMLHRDLEEKAQIFAEAVSLQGTCVQRLHRLTLDYFRLPQWKREAISLVRRDVNRFGGEQREGIVRAYQKALPGPVETILQSGMDTGEIPKNDAKLLAWSYVALVEVSLNPHAESIFPNIEAKLAHLLNLFFCGAMSASSEAINKRKAS
ncbi:MAG: TetR/AcrR family transcriptional regulator [Planctomycetota bacterium]